MPISRWATHSASFCLGAATAAIMMAMQTQSQQSSKRKEGSNESAEDLGFSQSTFHAGETATNSQSTIPMNKMTPSLPVKLYQPNDNLFIAFDARTKNPVYVLERLTAFNLKNFPKKNKINAVNNHQIMASRKNKHFTAETTLPPTHRSLNSHYKHSGYDRGHLAPAADFPFSDEEMEDTFVLTNISPQLPRVNRGSWLRLEEFVRDVVVAADEGSCDGEEMETWVVSGPIWLPSSRTDQTSSGGEGFRYSFDGIGKPPSVVSVPTHFFKVVIVIGKGKTSISKSTRQSSGSCIEEKEIATKTRVVAIKKFGAFVLPNSEPQSSGVNKIRLVDYLVRLSDLETVTGMEFFPNILGSYDATTMEEDGLPINKEIADALTDDVRLYARSRGAGSGGIKSNNDNSIGKKKLIGNVDNTGAIESALVPLSNPEELSKGRQRKVNQILRDNSPVTFQHLCSKTDACFKLLSV
ncbi:hypothetical protein ACHAXS_000934 [Conticribra weissflogii]